MSARVIGIGHPAAGDDAVGLEVARRLRCGRRDPGVEIHETGDPSRLVEWLCGVDTAVVVDAVRDGGPPGRVVELGAGDAPDAAGTRFSTHGVGVAEAIGLAGAAHPHTVARRIVVVGVTIARPEPCRPGLSAPVEAAVGPAADAVRRILGGAR